MRKYYIYSIEEKFADYYYGREKMFYQLFVDYNTVSGNLVDIIKKQIDYITKPVPTLHIQRLLSRCFNKRNDFYMNGNQFRLEMNTVDSGVELSIKEDFLFLKAWGNFDAELALFEVLRQAEGRLLAIDLKNKRYGWLKPIREQRYI